MASDYRSVYRMDLDKNDGVCRHTILLSGEYSNYMLDRCFNFQ